MEAPLDAKNLYNIPRAILLFFFFFFFIANLIINFDRGAEK